MNSDVLIVSLSSLFNLALGALILIRNPRNRINQVFGIFSLIIIIWTVCNFAADHAPNLNLLYTQLTLLFGSGVLTTLFLLCSLFPVSKHFRRSWLVFYALSLLNFVLCFTPLYILSVRRTNHGAELTVGSLYTFFSVYILLAVIWSMIVLLRHARPQNRNQRDQIRFFALGIIIYTTFAFLSNVILPVLINNWTSSRFGPIFTIPFVAVMAYAIIKHHLFDMRLAIARTVGFFITIVAVSAIYSLLLLITAPIIASVHVTMAQVLLFLPPTIIVALTARSMQRLVAYMTSRVFLQDSYDSRAVLDRLSDALISDNDLKVIMAGGMQVLYGALRPTRLSLVVLDERGQLYRQHTLGKDAFVNFEQVSIAARHLHQRIAVKDEVAASSWQQAFDDNGIALVLKLEGDRHVTGILLLGPKQNGRVYTQQDIELLNVSSKNFGIAIENAKKYEQIAAFANTMHTEVLHATASLRKANKKLKTLDALKDDFISMASHQLRSPATSVHDAIKMLEQDYLKPAERQRIIELADASSERLVNVITDMLSVARIQAGHFMLEKDATDLSELVDRAVLQASALAKQKHVKLVVQKPATKLVIQADRAKVNEMMANYIENAIKYSHEQSAVHIELTQTASRADFVVRDDGIGVPKNEQKHLFVKFYRAVNARHEQPNGNGIGLFVVKTIAEAHDGGVYYQPQHPGSMFGFWLPL